MPLLDVALQTDITDLIRLEGAVARFITSRVRWLIPEINLMFSGLSRAVLLHCGSPRSSREKHPFPSQES